MVLVHNGHVLAQWSHLDWKDRMEPTPHTGATHDEHEQDHGGAVVSIVVPCFDVERYLDDCLASVVAQTYPAIEIVLINDGSTDSTGDMADAWSARDHRIRVIHQVNQGLGAARNVGVRAATGDYLFFLDSDDMLAPDAIGTLVRSLEASGSDFASGVAWQFNSSGEWRAAQYRSPFDRSRLATHLFQEPELVYDQMACSKLFTQEFWETEKLQFPEGTLYEDVVVAMTAHCRAHAVDLVADRTYLWRRREAGNRSITQDRHRRGSTTARFEALLEADDLLRLHAPPDVWVEHGVKVLTVDIRLYSRLLEHGDDHFAEEFLVAGGALARSISGDAVRRTNAVMAELHRNLCHGNASGIVSCVRLLSGTEGRSARRSAAGVMELARRDPKALLRIARGSMTRTRPRQR